MSIRENILPVEVKKDGLSQLQDGSWVLKLKVHPNDMQVPLMQAPMGTRYTAALVEMNDDETIKVQPKQNHKLATQAGILCTEPAFRRFLWEQGHVESETMPTEDEAVAAVRSLCGVDSRANIDGNPDAETKCHALLGEYRAWGAL